MKGWVGQKFRVVSCSPRKGRERLTGLAKNMPESPIYLAMCTLERPINLVIRTRYQLGRLARRLHLRNVHGQLEELHLSKRLQWHLVLYATRCFDL